MIPGALRVLLAPNPSPMTLDGTRTYVVGEHRPVVIDPGPADPQHLSRLHAELAGARPAAILLTHHHPDHAAAAPLLAAATGAPVWMAPGALEVGFARVRAHRWVAEGEVVETDGGALRAVATPGHAPEHLAFLWEGPGTPAGGVLFVGDLFMGVGDTTLIAPPEGDLSAYLVSLERVRQLKPGILLPAHGPPLDDPNRAVERYVHHRQERIGQVLDALRDAGPARPAELVDRVYPELDPRLRPAAQGSLHAILQYLHDQQRVHADPERRYRLVDTENRATTSNSQSTDRLT
jgi:glyoxylase-like metal-dependent hydrolase (beta-lactamase superfamily II)